MKDLYSQLDYDSHEVIVYHTSAYDSINLICRSYIYVDIYIYVYECNLTVYTCHLYIFLCLLRDCKLDFWRRP